MLDVDHSATDSESDTGAYLLSHHIRLADADVV